eukprot:PhF_6_TR14504/c0_g1_i1/m.23048
MSKIPLSIFPHSVLGNMRTAVKTVFQEVPSEDGTSYQLIHAGTIYATCGGGPIVGLLNCYRTVLETPAFHVCKKHFDALELPLDRSLARHLRLMNWDARAILSYAIRRELGLRLVQTPGGIYAAGNEKDYNVLLTNVIDDAVYAKVLGTHFPGKYHF